MKILSWDFCLFTTVENYIILYSCLKKEFFLEMVSVSFLHWDDFYAAGGKPKVIPS